MAEAETKGEANGLEKEKRNSFEPIEIEQISEITGISLEKIKKLKREN